MHATLLVLRILASAAACGAACYFIGDLLLLPLRSLLQRLERIALAYVLGAAFLSLAIFLIGVFWTVHPALYLAILAVSGAGWAVLRRRASVPVGAPLAFDPIPRRWLLLLAAVCAAYGTLYLVTALAPEVSPDGPAYHLGLPAQYLRNHRIAPTPTSFYAGLSQGIEMLFLFAFALGGHSAGALVHLKFLVALAMLLLSLGRRFGMPHVGIGAAILTAVTPVIGIDASSAYVDVALACTAFTCFYLLLLWEQHQRPLLAFYAGCVAGFCFAVKYSGAGAIPLGLLLLAFASWKRPRFAAVTLGLFSVGALLFAAPWPVRNTLWYGNPLAPFYNHIFPNTLMHVDFERRFREALQNWGNLPSKWLIPIELTVRGWSLQGLLGPVFFLVPLSLLALRDRLGRRVLAFAIALALFYPMNIGARFLIPSLPFFAFALMLAVARRRPAVAAIALAHCVLSWPAVELLYCNPYAWRIYDFPIRAALRLQSEDDFRAEKLGEWPTIQYLNSQAPRAARILSISGLAESYLQRTVLVPDNSAIGEQLRTIPWAAHFPQYQPREQIAVTFAPTSVPTKACAIRLIYQGPGAVDGWGMSELRIQGPNGEIPRDPQWQLSASANPYDVAAAFDNNPVTKWRTWEPVRKGMYIEVDFGHAIDIRSLLIQTSNDLASDSLSVAIRTESGWTALPSTVSRLPSLQEAPTWRRAAIDALRREHIDYLLLAPRDYMETDFHLNPQAWGVTEVHQSNGWRVFRLEP